MSTAKPAISYRKLILAAVYLLIFPVLILWLSGDWLWIEGWLFNLWFLALCSLTIIYLFRKDPALLAERYKIPGGSSRGKDRDRCVLSGIVLGFLFWIIIMPLDAKRFTWSFDFPSGLKVCGGAALILSAFLFYRSYTDNTFLSPLVRIQRERKQQVVSSGVYGFVRHPMYLAGILMFIGTPLLLSSKYGIVAGMFLIGLIVIRIIGEERMLVRELDDYAGYRNKVRYRLIPLIW